MSLPVNVTGAHIKWNDWEFDFDLVTWFGLVISLVRYKGRLILHKASVPVIRVKYDDDTGPFNDQLGSSGFKEFTDCENKLVCVTSFDWDGTEWLDVRCGCHIGAYRLQQAWWFSGDGRIAPRVWSRGVFQATNHVHHVYWRLDFDADSGDHNDVWVNDDAALAHYTLETAVDKKPGRRWIVVNNRTGRGVAIVPGPHDGKADGFSKADFAIRRFHDEEDEPWPFGPWSGLGYDDNESVADTDVVVWYIAHLFHEASHEEEGSLGEWHSGGPIMQIGVGLPSLRDFFELLAHQPGNGVRNVMVEASVFSLRELMGLR